jgi:hypothetical protein
MKLTTQHHLIPRLRISGAKPRHTRHKVQQILSNFDIICCTCTPLYIPRWLRPCRDRNMYEDQILYNMSLVWNTDYVKPSSFRVDSMRNLMAGQWVVSDMKYAKRCPEGQDLATMHSFSLLPWNNIKTGLFCFADQMLRPFFYHICTHTAYSPTTTTHYRH